MIENLEVVSEELALADGPKYHLGRVLAASKRFLRFFTEGVQQLEREACPILRFPSEECLLDDEGYRRFNAYWQFLSTRYYDVISSSLQVIVGSFSVRAYLLGTDELSRPDSRSEPITEAGAEWSELKVSPEMRINPSGAEGDDVYFPFFSARTLPLARALAITHGRLARLDVEERRGVFHLHFPDHLFRSGFGQLRIALSRRTTD